MQSAEYTDIIQPFLIDKSSVKGKMVRLGESLDTILHRHDYPEPVSRLLGELLIMISMLGYTLKIDGILTAQMKSDGVVKFLVADCNAKGEIRGYAEYDELKLKAAANHDFKSLVGEGYLAITLDPGEGMERYQGIVGLEGNSLLDSLRSYFVASEQVDMACKIFIGQNYGADGKNRWVGGGIMVQKLPEEGGTRGPGQIRLDSVNPLTVEDNWNRASAFVSTAKDYELLDPALDPRELLYRLFHEDGVWAFEPREVAVGCRCSRERISGLLSSMTEEEIEDLTVEGKVTVTCQFCNKAEVFAGGELVIGS